VSSGALDAENALGAFRYDMRVDHLGPHILVTQQLLDSPDVISIFQQVGGERMTEGVRGNPLDNARRSDRLLDGPLDR